MTPINDGGPAFPQVEILPPGHYRTGPPPPTGMTLRDYFAAKAMQSLLSITTPDGHAYNPKLIDCDFVEAEIEPGYAWYKQKSGFWSQLLQVPGDNSAYYNQPYRLITTYEHRLSRECYEIADAMLSHSEKEQEPTDAQE